MDTEERARVQERVDQWRRSAPVLRELRRRSVAGLSDADGRRAALDLAASLDLLPPRPPRPSSGLVEQQRLLAQLRES